MMPITEYLKKREVQIALLVTFLVAILVLYQVGAFIVYGIPAITFHAATQTKPVSKSINILSSYGDWVAYDYYEVVERKWESHLKVWGRFVKVGLKANIGVKVEVTDLMLSGFLTEIKPPPFLIEETETSIYYKNITVQSYAYGFKVTLAWTGTAQVVIVETGQWGLVPPGTESMETMVKKCVEELLVPDFNKFCYIASSLLMTVDAPTLATDKAYELRPDYLGICGMWLADYVTQGQTFGTGVEAAPSGRGTAVKLFRDKALTSPCWAPDYDAPMGKPLLTPDLVYWLDAFAPPSAWWKIDIIHLGSKLVYDETKPHPNYISWAWEAYPSSPAESPAVSQWFRVDVAFRVTDDWIVPRIPDYELPPEEKEKMRIIIEWKPDVVAPPLNDPSEETWTISLSQLIPIILVIFGGTIATVIVYYYAKAKWKVK